MSGLKAIHFIAAGCVTAALLTSGCNQGPPVYRTNQHLALDISDQRKERLDITGRIGYEVERRAQPDERVRVYLFAHTFEIAYDAAPLKSKSKFNAAIGGRLNKPSAEMHIPDTRTDVILAELASLDTLRPTEIILVTDGGIENLGPEVVKSITDSISRLAANRKIVRFLILGVQQEHRKRWDTWISPLGSRGHVYGGNDYQEGLKSIGRFPQ